MRILVAEDDDAIRDLMAEVLIYEGHEIVRVSTAEEVLSLGRAECWDLFVIDTLGWADYAPTEECKGFVQALAVHAPVILCTGRSWARGIRPSELGAAAIVFKPFDISELIESVAAVGGRQAATLQPGVRCYRSTSRPRPSRRHRP